jgi:hypothetical protein
MGLDCPDRDSLLAYYEDALRAHTQGDGTSEAVELCRKALHDHCQMHGCDPHGSASVRASGVRES